MLNLYRGEFNFHGQKLDDLWCYAKDEFKAWGLFMRQIHKKLDDPNLYVIKQHFNGSRDNYRITRKKVK